MNPVSMPPSPISMLQSGQILCDQYRLVERLGRRPGRQTWRALDLKCALNGDLKRDRGNAGSGTQAVAASRPITKDRPERLLADDPWDSGELSATGVATSDLAGQADDLGQAASEPGSGSDTASNAEAAETVIVKLLAFSDEIDWGQVKLFEREAAVLKGLSHPALPRYRDSFSVEDRLLWFGLVQDDIPGQSLDQLLAEGGTQLTEAQLRQWAGELLEILIYLHGQSPPILHRDIKPSNVIWGDDQQIYLIDLGAVQDYVAKASLGSSFTVVGTYGYAPLEQFGGRSVPASDLYALGATLVHLLTGIAPADLPQENLRLQFEAAMGADISPSFCRWLQHLLEPDVQRRTPSARAALAALQQLPGSAFPRYQPNQAQGPVVRQDSSTQLPNGPSRQHRDFLVPPSTEPYPAGPIQSVPPVADGPLVVQSSPGMSPLISRESMVNPQAVNPIGSLERPPSDALAPASARLRLKRSPDLLLVEMPGEELGYVFAVLGVGFSIWALLASSVTLPFCLLFTLLGMFLATPQVLRFERRGRDIRFSLGKQLGGYLLRWGRRRASGSLRQVFHTVESSARSSQVREGETGIGQRRLRDDREPRRRTTDFGPWLNREGFGGLQSNRRTLIVQTQQGEIPISTSLSWQEGTWLVDQIYAWCDEV